MDLNNIVLNFNKIINLYEYKIKEYDDINNKIILLEDNIRNTINNNDNIFNKRIIKDKEYKNNCNKINNLYNDLIKVSNKNLISKDLFYDNNLKIDIIIKDLKILNEKVCSDKLIDVLNIFDNNWKKNIFNNFLDLILFYNKFFICINFNISNDSKKENCTIEFVKNNNKNSNIYEDIFGLNFKIYLNNKIINIYGYFNNDNLNIIRNNIILKKKNDYVSNQLKKESIPDKFKNDFFKQLTLRNFIVHSPKEIVNLIKEGYSNYISYKSISLSTLLNIFSTANFDKQRDILTILIISESKLSTLASLLYDILLKSNDTFNAKILYISLHNFVQNKFDFVLNNFNDNVNKIKNISLEDIPYEKKILLLDTSDLNKSKALDKLKIINNGIFGSNDNKPQTWLDGFLKIPFNCYKTNKIFNFIDNYKFILNQFIQNIKTNNQELYDILNKYDYPETDYQIDSFLNNINNYFDKYIQIIDDNSTKDKIYDDFKDIINKWQNYIEDRKTFILNVRHKLNVSVYGNDKSKKTIETIIAQWISGQNNGAIIGFNGPPGVGKTTIAKKGISECLIDDNNNTRPFAFISLGGSSAGSTLEGHNYTYLGSTWGKIVDILIDSKCLNPIIFFDEVDKISNTEHGKEIVGILTHLTDQTQNDKQIGEQNR